MSRYVSPPPTDLRVTIGRIPEGFPGTKRTVAYIKDMIRKGARDFFVRQKAIDILMEARVPPKDYLGEINALFRWVQTNIRYTRDPYQVETLHSARRMLELRAGDCDDMAILLGSMLKSVGFPVRLVLAGFNAKDHDQFSHIYLEVQYQNRWIPLDATMPFQVGWNPPAAHYRVFSIEKESDMYSMTDQEFQGLMGSQANPVGEAPYQLLQTVDGLGNVGVAYAPVSSYPYSQTNSWVRDLLRRMWQQGVSRRDAQVRTLSRLLQKQGRLGRGSFAQTFLRSVYRQGIQSRNQQTRQLYQQLRSWGIIPQVTAPNAMPWTGNIYNPPGSTGWYQQPPWWYNQPPAWMRNMLPQAMNAQFRPGLPPAAILNQVRPAANAAMWPMTMANTAARAATAPLNIANTAAQVATAPLTMPFQFLKKLF